MLDNILRFDRQCRPASSSTSCPFIRTERCTACESEDPPLAATAPRLHMAQRLFCSCVRFGHIELCAGALWRRTGCSAPRQTGVIDDPLTAVVALKIARELRESWGRQCPRSTSSTGARPLSRSAVCAATFLTHTSTSSIWCRARWRPQRKCSLDLRETAPRRLGRLGAIGTVVMVPWLADRHVESVAGMA